MTLVEEAALRWYKARIACAACSTFDVRKDKGFTEALKELADAEYNLAQEVKKLVGPQ